jgi:hypothetical protein
MKGVEAMADNKDTLDLRGTLKEPMVIFTLALALLVLLLFLVGGGLPELGRL